MLKSMRVKPDDNEQSRLFMREVREQVTCCSARPETMTTGPSRRCGVAFAGTTAEFVATACITPPPTCGPG